VIDATAPTLVLDGVLVAAGAASALTAWKVVRGRLSPGLILASIGLLILGFGHLLETLMWTFLAFTGDDAIELSHRIVVLSGFVWLVYGLARVGRELWQEWERVLQANAALIVAEEDLRLANEELKERNRQLLDAHAQAPAKRPISVAIVGPDPNLRRILAALLADESDFQTVGEAADAREARSVAQRHSPDVILLDDALADTGLIAALKSTSASSKIIVLASYRAGALDALAMGARDYVLKDAGADHLATAIRRAIRRRSQLEVDAL